MKWILLAVLALPLAADLSKVAAEPNPEKRSQKALEHANLVYSDTRKAYREGDMQLVRSGLAEIKEAVDLALTSLRLKSPRKATKYYKKAEIMTRDLARRLDAFRIEAGVEDREPIEKLLKHVQEVHEELIQAIMRKK